MKPKDINVLVACEYSGIVRDAFTLRGFNAYSCDLLDTEKPGKHYMCDIKEVISKHWHLMIAHPPCTYLTNAGVSWLYNKDGSRNVKRWQNLKEGAVFFNSLLNAQIPLIAIENPIPHKYAVEFIGKKYDQCIQPYHFGHPESKATCFWLKGLPKLKPTKNVKEIWKQLPKKEAQRLHYLSPSLQRAKLRAKTFPGIAQAMAEQWGNYLIETL